MPYPGIKDKEDMDFMEKCSMDVMHKQGKDKSSAIAICRSVLNKKKEKKSSIEYNDKDTDLQYVDGMLQLYIEKTMRNLSLSEVDARYLSEAKLARSNYNIEELLKS